MKKSIDFNLGIGPVFDRIQVSLPADSKPSFFSKGQAALCHQVFIYPEVIHKAYGLYLLKEQGLSTENVTPIVPVNSFKWFLEYLMTGMIIADYSKSYNVWYSFTKSQNKSGISIVLFFEPKSINGKDFPKAICDELEYEFPLSERGIGIFPKTATPLCRWIPPDTVMTFWKDNFVIPDFSAISLGSPILSEPALDVASWSDQTLEFNNRIYKICYRHYEIIEGN